MDAEALEVEPASFDAVLCSFVLHLLPEPERAAAGSRRALRHGGRLVAGAPSGAGPSWDFMRRIFGAYAPRVTRPLVVPFWPDFDLPATVASAGFEVERVVEEEVEFHFPGAPAWWAWAWSQGMRDLLEALSPSDLEELRLEMFAELGSLMTSDGIPLRQQATFVVARP